MTLFRLLASAAIVALVLAACSSTTKSVSTGSAAPPTAAPTSAPLAATPGSATPPAGGSGSRGALAAIGPAAASSDTLSLAKGPQGIYLIAANGHALYVFGKDSGTTSACTSAACAKAWPAYTATGPITTGPGVTKAQVTTATGQVANQLAYYGHLLYFFAPDAAPGQTSGDGINTFDLLGPFGNVMLPRG